VWDICGLAGPTQVLDADTGTPITTVGLQGVPSWSPDGRRIATMDHLDGMVKIADVTAGTIEVVADPQFGPYRTGDSCGTFAKVGWSPDGASLLLQYGGTYGDDIVVRVLRVDGSGDRKLFQQPQAPGAFWQLDARWLTDGNVMIAYFASDTSGDIGVLRDDPWGSWPPPATSVPRPDFRHVYSPSISPTGDHIALAVMGDVPADGCSTAASCTGGIVMVDLADGSARTISTHMPAGPETFSPDGSQVAFVGNDYDLTEPAILVVTSVDGSAERIIPGVAGNTASWSPDGRAVVVGGFAVRRADLDSGAVVELVPQPSGTEGSSEFAADWRPKTDGS
jgi:Tol biopolymer transport system component